MRLAPRRARPRLPLSNLQQKPNGELSRIFTPNRGRRIAYAGKRFLRLSVETFQIIAHFVTGEGQGLPAKVPFIEHAVRSGTAGRGGDKILNRQADASYSLLLCSSISRSNSPIS